MAPEPATPDVATADPDELDDLDRELLNALQWDFPLVARPYAALGERLGISEAEVLRRTRRVKESGVLRQLSAIFDTRALGYSSALVAARIEPDHIDEAAAIISRHPGVSHNYKRNHSYNLWYTLAVPPGEDFDEHLDALHRESGALVTRKLPTLKLYKIGVKLDMTGNTAANAKAEVLAHEKPERRADMEAPELSAWDTAVICIAQEDLPLVERPFAAQAAAIGGTEDELLATLQSFTDRKLMRRFAAVMNHRSAGFKANAMGVWAVPEDQLEEIGPQMAGLRRGVALLPAADLRGLAVHRVHDGPRPHRQGLRGDDRRDPGRDRGRRVRPALVDQGVQEGPAPLLRPRVGRVAGRAPQPNQLGPRRRRRFRRRRRSSSVNPVAMPAAATPAAIAIVRSEGTCDGGRASTVSRIVSSLVWLGAHPSACSRSDATTQGNTR